MTTRRGRTRVVAVLSALLVLAAATYTTAPAVAADTPDSSSDFVPLAIEGFEEAVAGPGGLVPNPDGNRLNDYIWAAAEFDGALLVGTVRGVLDLFSLTDTTTLGRYRAEIWRYDWGGSDGSEGTWTRVFQSPLVAGAIPRDFGFRNMTECGGRLYVASIGILPRILASSDGYSFVEASRRGLPDGDLGFRSLECLDGWLITSPLGTLADPDIATNPVMLANRFPMFGAWQEISLPGFGDPENLGVFATTLWDRDGDGDEDTVVAGTINRTTGAEVWVNTDPCGFILCSGAVGSWERLVDWGAGRPFDPPWLRSDGEWGPANAGVAWMVEFGGSIWMGLAESGFSPTGLSLAEIVVLHRDGTWDVVAGYPRAGWEGVTVPADFSAYAAYGGTASSYLDLLSLDGIPEFYTDGPGVAIPYPLAGNSCDPGVDPANPDCLPTSDRGPGMLPFDPVQAPPGFALGAFDGAIAGLYALVGAPFPSGLGVALPPLGGPASTVGWDAVDPLVRSFVMIQLILDQQLASYIWQLEVHDDRLYVSTLDVFNGDGFDMYVTDGGAAPTWDVVFTDGLGAATNYGGRKLLSTDHGLVVGTANPFGDREDVPDRGGAEIWLGTCDVDSDPTADAGPDQQFPNTPVSHEFGLDGTASDGFCGSVTSTAWYEGTCDSLGTQVSADEDPTGFDEATGTPVAEYHYAFVVTDDDANESCDETTVRIGTGDAPTVTIPDEGSGCNLAAFAPGEELVGCDDGRPEFRDKNLDDMVITTMTAECVAGDGSTAIACEFDENDVWTELVGTSGSPVDEVDIEISRVSIVEPRPIIMVSTTDPATGFTASASVGIDTDAVNQERGVVAEMNGTSVRTGFFRWTGLVEVLVTDSTGSENPVEGVEVTIIENSPLSSVDPVVCTTGADGRCAAIVGPFLGESATMTVSGLALPGRAGFHLAAVNDTVILQRPEGLVSIF